MTAILLVPIALSSTFGSPAVSPFREVQDFTDLPIL